MIEIKDKNIIIEDCSINLSMSFETVYSILADKMVAFSNKVNRQYFITVKSDEFYGINFYMTIHFSETTDLISVITLEPDYEMLRDQETELEVIVARNKLLLANRIGNESNIIEGLTTFENEDIIVEALYNRDKQIYQVSIQKNDSLYLN